MYRRILSRFAKLNTVLVIALLLFSSVGIAASAQLPNSAQAGTAQMLAGALYQPVWSATPPQLTAEQQATIQYWTPRMNRSGPVASGPADQVAGPPPATSSAQQTPVVLSDGTAGPQAVAPGDFVIGRNKSFSSIIPSGYSATVMEPSVLNQGKNAFYTGNWFAARSTNGGSTWFYVNPYADFANFCCDQAAAADVSHNVGFWLRLGIPGYNGSNYENTFQLSVSSNNFSTWCNYSIRPLDVNSSWTNMWFDYPHEIQFAANNLYMTYNMFNVSGLFVQDVVFRWPIDALASCAGFSYNYFTASDWFTWALVQGADHTMYWASNWPLSAPQNNRIRIYSWNEDSNTIFWSDHTVTAWTFTNRGGAVCSPTFNWTSRLDQRVMAGARYMIQNTNVKIPGRKILGWFWTVQQGSGFTYPYIEAAAFYEDTLAQVTGGQGRPLVWNSTTCFAYPSVAANVRGDEGLIFNYATSTNSFAPSIGATIADDYTTAPPGWTYYVVAQGVGLPGDSSWGDYNTTRLFEPSERAWSSAAHYISGATGSTPIPDFFVFFRGRDNNSWSYWSGK